MDEWPSDDEQSLGDASNMAQFFMFHGFWFVLIGEESNVNDVFIEIRGFIVKLWSGVRKLNDECG